VKQRAITGLLGGMLFLLSGQVTVAGEPRPGETDAEEAVRRWVEEWGEKWYERYHPDYDARYPGGRSNRYHDAYLEKIFRRFDLPANENWVISNRRYHYDGDWFIVEWLFQAEDKQTGRLQREGTLALGRIRDDRLIEFIEYFDGFVAHLQRLGALPLFDEDATPFPWPENDTLIRPYRP